MLDELPKAQGDQAARAGRTGELGEGARGFMLEYALDPGELVAPSWSCKLSPQAAELPSMLSS